MPISKSSTSQTASLFSIVSWARLTLIAFMLCSSIKPAIANDIEPTTSVQAFELGSKTLQVNENSVFYRFSGDPQALGLIFVHGTPGDWGAFERYLRHRSLQQRFFMVSLDRPGWGKSSLDTKKVDGDFKLQSKAIGEIFAEYPDKKWIVIGHSLGASIAPKVALDHPKQTRGLLLLAGSLKPSLGAPRWYNRAANTWLVSRLVGKPMRNSNREIIGLKQQLTELDLQLTDTKLEAHAVVLQGMKDRLVSPKNADYANKAWRQSFASLDVIELKGAGHFLPWRQQPLVIELIEQLATKIAKSE